MKTKVFFTSLITLALVVGLTGVALAFNSGGNPGETGPNTIVWTGQGASNGEVTTEICPSTDALPGGIDPYNYLHWIFTTDGGSADSVATLYLGGTGSGVYHTTKDSGSAFHFFTPYFTPDSNLTAYVEFNVLTTGNGSWNLVISHGCAGIQDLTVTKTANPTYTRTFDWTIEKSADKTKVYSAGGGASDEVTYTVKVTKDAGTDSGWAVSGVITVYNPNGFGVSGVSLVDSTPGGDCIVTPAVVDVGAKSNATANYVCTFTANPGSGINTVIATWPPIGSPNTSATYEAPYVFGEPTTKVNNCITVVDDLDPESPRSFCASAEYNYAIKFYDPAGTCTSHTNTATIVELDKSASVTVEDCQGADLIVEKTAEPAYDMTYVWEISKDVDLTWIKVDPGQPVDFHYTVVVSHDAGTESNWAVNGEITVTNPNDWQDIVAEVTDVLAGGSCLITGDTIITVPASGSVTLPYSCTFTSKPEPGTNYATATWDGPAYHTPSSAAEGSAAFEFGDPTNVIDGCIDVTDSLAGFLGTVCVGDDNPYTFEYTLTFYGPSGGTCQDKDNTSTFVTDDTGTTGEDSESVTICSWMARLTPGYWKNHLYFNPKNPLQPYVQAFLPVNLGTFPVTSPSVATSIWNSMNCSNTGSNSKLNQNAIGCLAGHLLAAKLNYANGANPCIADTISGSDMFLASILYEGPTGNYSGIGTENRNLAIYWKSLLDAYNNGGGCH